MISVPEYRKLDAYGKAIEALVALDRIAISVGRSRPDLKDQLQRAAASLVLNLAEGAGEYSPSEKARFYRMARRSATERQAVLDIVDAIVAPQLPTDAARATTSEVAAMLTGMVKSVEARRR